MPSQNPDSEIQFVVIILVIAIFVFVLTLVAIFAALFPKHGLKVADGSASELKPGSLAARLAALFPKDGSKKEFTSSQRALKAIGSVFLTAALMFGLASALVYAYNLKTGGSDFFSPFWGSGISLIGTAVGGAIGVRISRLSWRQTIVAALLSGVGWIVLSRFEFPPLLFGPWYPTDSEMALNLRAVPIFLLIICSGVFFLPLFDPIVRQAIPSPSLMFSQLKPPQRAVRVMWKVSFMVVLLTGLELVLVRGYALMLGVAFITPSIAALLILIGAAAGGILGMFLMPMFDSVVKQASPALAIWKVALAAIFLALLIMSINYLISVRSFQGLSDFGLLTLMFGSILSAILVGIGLILGLVNLTAAGARFGSLGIVLEAFILTAWWLLGTPWFP